jgi:hypothetical protein
MIKSVLLRIFLFIHIIFLLTPTVGTTAPRNGDGIVFHHSDCGFPYVRYYSDGGDSRGSSCGNWVRYEAEQVIWYNGDHNWTIAELEERLNLPVMFLGNGQGGAPQNGRGAVYNKSDCGFPNVRWYSNGGNGPGSRCGCGRWGLSDAQCSKVWGNGAYNWTQCDLETPMCKAGQAIVSAANFVNAHIVQVCKVVLSPLLNQLIGRSCVIAGTQFEAECNGSLDAEEGPFGATACASAGGALVAECKIDGKMTVRAVKPILNKVCERL